MKKFLLPAAMFAMVASAPVYAGVETTKYDTVDGIECTNLYNISRNLDGELGTAEFNAAPFAEFGNKTRSMALKDGKLYIAHSRTMVEGEDSNDYAHLIVYDQLTGKFLYQVQLTVDGAPLKGLLCANQIGFDDFGNLWLIGLCGDTSKTPWRIYHVKDLVNGQTELVAELMLSEDEIDAKGRHDYYDLVGDVTGKESNTIVMSPVASGDKCYVVGYNREQGTDQWNPHMSGGEYYSLEAAETYPADKTSWNGAPMVRIIRDEEHSGELYYVDSFETYPALYNTEGAMVDGFINSDAEMLPKANANGVMEFSLAGIDYLVYTKQDYDGAPGTQVRVAKMGDGMSFDGLAVSWDLPANGLGTLTDSGSRMMGICPSVVTDDAGKQACYLSIYKCNGGLATYRINEPGYKNGVDAIQADNTDNNAPVEMFNLNGVRVDAAAAAPGLYITRQGTAVSKVVIK